MNPLLIKVAHDTVNISKKREYLNNSGQKQIFTTKYLPKTISNQKDLTAITVKNLELIPVPQTSVDPSKINVLNEGTVEAIMRLSKTCQEETIGILNFASAHSPGGGFLNGSVAQEECLCYCSELYTQQANQEYYEINKIKNKFYTDTMIFSQTNFFKDAKYKFLDAPINVLVITCPAVNMRIAGNTKEAKDAMKNRMRKILNAFAIAGVKNIVLGAYGCGVFKNDPVDIATAWKDLLITEKYINFFETVSFSIIGNKNLEPFKKIINS